MKKMLFLCLAFAVLLIGAGFGGDAMLHCAAEAPAAVLPLQDAVMENLTDAILAVSMAEGDVYLDDEGKLQMKVKIYAYDQYDLVDVALLQAGDILVTHAGEVEVVSVEHKEGGLIAVNGGCEAGGWTLATDEGGVYYAVDADGVKVWYEAGEATLRVSDDFEGHDLSDSEQGEVIFYAGSFLVNEIDSYDFTPYNTTIRVEAGLVVELHRMCMH